MLYLEELVDVVIAEEGQTLMGLDFLYKTLNLPMTKVEKIFKKALSEYSERRPMKKTEVFNNYDMNGYITMPEGTTSCRVARYGVLPNQMPRYYMPTFGEEYVEFDPTTLQCRVWPPVTPLRLTYTQKYIPTKSILIEKSYSMPVQTDEFCTELDTMFAGNSLTIQKAVTTVNPVTGEEEAMILSMSATGDIEEEENLGEIGTFTKKAILDGSLGTGTVDLNTLEVELELADSSTSPLFFTYYPKYYVVKELDIGHYVFTKLFASKLLTALASLRAQATQEKLHNINLTTDNLYERAQALKEEVAKLLKSTWSYGGAAPE